MPTRIKICGITRPADAQAAADLGVDAIGLVFYPASPRYIDIDRACVIAQAATPFVTRVGLFMDADCEQVSQVLDAVPLDLLQFHGRETSEYCESFGKTYIKSVPMLDAPDLSRFMADYPAAAGFLLDAVQSGEAGGQGRTFQWRDISSLAGQGQHRPLILAGGLTPENVADALRVCPCYAVDVSSGVEAQKGIKSADKMRRFVNEVRSVQ